MRPTSDQSKKAAGTFRPAVARPPLGVPVGEPEPPEWLSEMAQAEWKLVVPDLQKSGVLAKVDRMMLAIYAELAAEFAEEPRKMSAGRLKELRMVCGELGLSLSARLKIKSPEPAAPESDDKWTPKSDGNVVSISRLLSATPKGSSAEKLTPAGMSASPVNDS